MDITKEEQLKAFNRYWDRAKLECLEAIELGMEWSVELGVADKDNQKIDRVITLKYALAPHLMAK